jgi:LysM repeat protein
MRKYSLFFRCPSSLARCAAALCLGVLLLVPVSLCARSRHVRHRHSTHRVHRHQRAAVRPVAAHSTARYRRYRVRRGDSLTSIAGKFGTSVAELRECNHLRSNRIQAGHSLYVPIPARADREVRQVAAADRPSSYSVRPGDTLTGIASRFGLTIAELRHANRLPTSRIVAGQQLDLPVSAEAPHAMAALDRPDSYRVRRGDTLSEIASRFGTTTSELRRLNGLHSNRVDVGQHLDVAAPAQRQESQTRQLASAPATSTHAPALPAATPAHVTNVSQPVAQQAELKDAVAYGAAPHLRGAILRETAIPDSMPTALYGTHEILVHQNIIADVEGLKRIQTTAELDTMIRDGDLVPLPLSSGLIPDDHLAENRRYCRPWTAKFLEDLSRAHDKLFGRPLRITSAVRTARFQRRLSRRNANAAPTSGEIASPHLTGEAIDIGKKGMSRHEIAWMRDVLGKLQAAGKLDVEEEFHQACFHISVYKTYVPTYRAPERLVAAEKAPSLAASGDAAEQSSEATVKKASTRSSRRSPERRVRHSRTRESRRALAARRRHRRSHHSVSLLAAGIR